MAETPQTQPVNPPQGTQLRTNHNVRIVTLTTAERVLACLEKSVKTMNLRLK